MKMKRRNIKKTPFALFNKSNDDDDDVGRRRDNVDVDVKFNYKKEEGKNKNKIMYSTDSLPFVYLIAKELLASRRR
jgi:hypothetical protein